MMFVLSEICCRLPLERMTRVLRFMILVILTLPLFARPSATSMGTRESFATGGTQSKSWLKAVRLLRWRTFWVSDIDLAVPLYVIVADWNCLVNLLHIVFSVWESAYSEPIGKLGIRYFSAFCCSSRTVGMLYYYFSLWRQVLVWNGIKVKFSNCF